MTLRISARAENDLAAIHEYIAEENPPAADRTIDRILQSIMTLERFPFLGHQGRVAGTREWPVSRLSYFAVYRVVGERDVVIDNVVHVRRQWPPPSR